MIPIKLYFKLKKYEWRVGKWNIRFTANNSIDDEEDEDFEEIEEFSDIICCEEPDEFIENDIPVIGEYDGEIEEESKEDPQEESIDESYYTSGIKHSAEIVDEFNFEKRPKKNLKELEKRSRLQSDLMIQKYLYGYNPNSFVVEEPFDEKLEKHIQQIKTRSLNGEKTFSELLISFIDKKHLTDVAVYTKARIDRRLFSKIRSNKYYHPSFGTCTQLALAMELNKDEYIQLLNSANYALTAQCYANTIIEYCFENHVYDVDKVNYYLLHYTHKSLKNL